ncbi:MAG TPA: Smr/MutS family protein [bacterium]|nr:Smr/MutS family protein [bacterium]
MQHEWAQILDMVAEGCFSAAGRRHIHDLAPLSRGEAEREFRLIGETATLSETGVAIFNYDLDRVSGVVERFRRDESLEPMDYRVVGDLLEQLRRAKQEMGRQTWVREFALLFAPFEPDVSLEMTIKQTVDKKGEISSDASPELARIRRHIADTHQLIGREIKRMIADPAVGGMLQEDYFTIRDDRYVLPFKTQFKRVMNGVVHNLSRSGQTAFLEPLALVELNNRLSLLASHEQNEILKVLRELRGLLGRRIDHVEACVGLALRLESLYARQRWMRSYDCAMPEFIDEGAAADEVWYPPVLAALKKGTVRNTFRFKEGERIMVISGPNAGGKTVALKSFHTVVELARRGIPVPAKRAQIPFFDEVFLVLGDQQDAAEGESSFSAHLRNLAAIAHRAGERSLVLVDEIGTGTDPQQGGAIARAFLEFLRDRRSFTVVTSHLAEVKAIALEDPAFVPVAMGFDEKHERPTYRFMYHLVGGSNALALVRRMDFPPQLVRLLENLLSSRDGSIEPLLNRLRQKEQDLDEEQERIAALKAETIKQKEEIAALERKLAQKERSFEQERLKMLKKLMELEETQLRRRVEETDAKNAAKRIGIVRKEKEALSQAIEREKAKADETPGVPLAEAQGVRVGETVVYDRLTKIKGVLSALKGVKAEVTTGGKSVLVPVERLIVVDEKRKKRAVAAPVDTGAACFEKCDVRGMTVEDACALVEKTVDGAYAAKSIAVAVIHGHGTGALKKGVRNYLEQLAGRYHFVWRSAPTEQGGDGTTLVEFS